VKRQLAEARGRKGENWASWWLRLQGWSILDTRVKTPRGEIDLVAKRGRLVVFVEVKWRRTGEELDLAIDEWRLSRVAAAVEAVSHRYAMPGDTIRIDVLLLAPGRWPRHIVNAWQP